MLDFHDLYTRHAADVHRFALFLSGDRALADDITSEAFLRAWSASAPIREATVKSYLFTIARNVYLHELRRGRRRVDLPPEMQEELPAPEASPERDAAAGSALDAVLAALATLPETDRAALLMRAQDELSYAEIGGALGLSEGAVRVRIHRARLKLATLVPNEALP